MAKSTDKRLRVAYTMPQLHRKKPGEKYSVEKDEISEWIKNQPELLDFLFDRLKAWGYIRYDPETGTWGGTGNDD